MKFWFEFEKTGVMKYVSYLDLLQILARGMNKSGLALAFSKGYNPQPKISFAHPLPLGVNARKDYGELELDVSHTDNIALDRVSQVTANLPLGFNIKRSKTPNVEKLPKLMSIVHASAYCFDFSSIYTPCQLEERLQKTWVDGDLIIEKKQKKSGKYKKKDLKPLIYELKQQGAMVETVFKAGSEGNLRPDDFVRAILNNASLTHYISIERHEIYTEIKYKENRCFIPLWNYDQKVAEIDSR